MFSNRKGVPVWNGKQGSLIKKLPLYAKKNGRFPKNIVAALDKNPELLSKAQFKALGTLLNPTSNRHAQCKLFLERSLVPSDTIIWAYFLYVTGETAESELLLDALANSEDTQTAKRAKRLRYFTQRRWEPTQVEGKPPVIFQFWDKDMPEDVARAVGEWRDLFGPDKHRLFNEEEARDLIRDHCGEEAIVAWDMTWSAAMKADLFRLVAIHRFGGVYIDADLGSRPNSGSILRQLSGESFVHASSSSPRFTISNGLIGAAPNWIVLAECADRAFREIRRNPDQPIIQLTGPGLFSTVLVEIDGPDTRVLHNGLVRRNLIRSINAGYKKTGLYWKKQQRRRMSGATDPEKQ